MNALDMVWAFAITKVFKPPRGDATAIVMEHIVRQEDTAIYVGVAIASLITAALRLRGNEKQGQGSALDPLKAQP